MATYIIESKKSVEETSEALKIAVANHKFGILHVYDLQSKLKEKGQDLAHKSFVYEICNPKIACEVLTVNMDVSLGLPCRISVYEDNEGKVKVGTVLPAAILGAIVKETESGKISDIAGSVELTLKQIIDDTCK